MESPCPRCEPATPAPTRDLDSDFRTYELAYAAFNGVKTADDIEVLLDHTKEYYKSVLDTQGIVRDKAKLLFGATSFSLAVFTTGVALLKESFEGASLWIVLPLLVLCVIIAIHFARALVHALRAITREATCAVSTQDYLSALTSAVDGEDHRIDASRQLAAHFRFVATETNNLMIPRKDMLMLAQGCFKWGLILLPLLVLASLAEVYIVGTDRVPRWADPLVANSKRTEERLSLIEPRLTILERSVTSIGRAGLVPRIGDLEKRSPALQQNVDRLGNDLHELRLDVDKARDQAKGDGKQTRAEVQSLADRLKMIDQRLEAIARKLPPKSDAIKRQLPSKARN